MCKVFYDGGYSFTYSSINYHEERLKHGALTELVKESDQFKVIPNVHSCDFASQYPNAML